MSEEARTAFLQWFAVFIALLPFILAAAAWFFHKPTPWQHWG